MALLLSIAARSSALMVQPMMMAVVAGQACRKADQPGLDPLLPRRRGSAPSHHTSKQQQDATTNTLRSSTNKQEGSWLEPPSSLVLPWLRCLSWTLHKNPLLPYYWLCERGGGGPRWRLHSTDCQCDSTSNGNGSPQRQAAPGPSSTAQQQHNTARQQQQQQQQKPALGWQGCCWRGESTDTHTPCTSLWNAYHSSSAVLPEVMSPGEEEGALRGSRAFHTHSLPCPPWR